MKRTIIYSISLLAVAGGLAAFFLSNRGAGARPGSLVLAETDQAKLIAAPGRVEPISEEINVSAEIRGKLKAVLVEEGDPVRRGEVIAELVNDDYRAQVAEAVARLQQKEAEMRRTVNGARHQERREALEKVKEAEAMLENARVEMERRQSLFEKGVIAREEADRAEREFKIARARLDGARERHDFIDDEAREEDRARAGADVALARAGLDEARARLEKTFVRSPIDGLVLRKHLKAGESVSEMRDTPIVTVADVSLLRVRVDVDETDVGKVRVGQAAYVTADAYGDRRFSGRIVRVSQVLGKKNVRTDDPAERVDTKVLETLIQLDEGSRLAAGLRVDAFIVLDGPLD
jgi:HlyD family secretion protein